MNCGKPIAHTALGRDGNFKKKRGLQGRLRLLKTDIYNLRQNASMLLCLSCHTFLVLCSKKLINHFRALKYPSLGIIRK
jgi:hypothetical protein